MFQGPSNQGFMQEKVQKGDFLKKPSRELIFFLFQVPMNLSKAWNAKLEAGIFLPSKNLYKQCAKSKILKNSFDPAGPRAFKK